MDYPLLTSISLFFIVLAVFVAIAVVIFIIILWIVMLIDCIKRDFKKDSDKIVWILLLILLTWLGAVLYYFIIFRKDKNFGKKK